MDSFHNFVMSLDMPLWAMAVVLIFVGLSPLVVTKWRKNGTGGDR